MHLRLTGKFFLAFVAITMVSLWCTVWYSVHVYKRQYLQTTLEDVSVRADLLKQLVGPLIADTARYRAIDSLCKATGPGIKTRITIILPSGTVIGDSKAFPDTMENHAYRPEVMQAMAGNIGVDRRYSATLRQNMLYVADPVLAGGDLAAIIRLSVPLKTIIDNENRFYLRIFLFSLFTLLLLATASILLARHLTKPIQEIQAGAQRFAAGELDFKLVIPRGDELAGLAVSLTTMAEALDDRIMTITRQRNELNTILSCMAEGVIAVDSTSHIISLNPAAAMILGITELPVNGKLLHEVVRNSSLHKFLADTLSADTKIETTIAFPGPNGEREIRLSGSVMTEGAEGPEGVVLVLNDITRLKKLENIRKDFVANVSHELRTPLTSIKGFVETLRTGSYAFNDEVTKFLEIIAAKTDRLCHIVDDLLTLSSIERENGALEIGFSDTNVAKVLDDAVNSCSEKAKGKNIAISLSCDAGLYALTNGPLLEQAVVNLIDNAVKYSEFGKTVAISAKAESGSITIAVADQGIGIAREHLTRIFERFYRVDKARSQKLGGTGLGLSIVKNIALALNGRVSVESESGKGSVFTLFLPVRSAQ